MSKKMDMRDMKDNRGGNCGGDGLFLPTPTHRLIAADDGIT
jgi:hypothetical protein